MNEYNRVVMIDLDEYNKLKELAELNQSQIDKKMNKIHQESIKSVSKEYHKIEQSVKEEYDWKLNRYKRQIKHIKNLCKTGQIFGYVKASIIEEACKNEFNE